MYITYKYIPTSYMHAHIIYSYMAYATPPPPRSVKYDASLIILLIIFDRARECIIVVIPIVYQPLSL